MIMANVRQIHHQSLSHSSVVSVEFAELRSNTNTAVNNLIVFEHLPCPMQECTNVLSHQNIH